jgi:nuclear pore complex protein Nup107
MLLKFATQYILQSACWAMAKSCLDVQVDLELARLPPGRMDQINSFGDVIDGSSGHSDGSLQSSDGPENWPVQVLNQQPRQLSALLQKLHSMYIAVSIQILESFMV